MGVDAIGVCPVGTYLSLVLDFTAINAGEDAGTCEPCAAECATCSGSPIHCTSCSDYRVMQRNAVAEVIDEHLMEGDEGYALSVVVDTCLETCPTGQSADPSRECKSCHEDCGACVGTSANDCSSCSDSTKFLRLGRCVENCPAGHYVDVNSECQECAAECDECSAADKCTTCAVDRPILYLGDCLSTCPKFTRAGDDGACEPCADSCLTCGSVTTTCTACDRTGALPTLEPISSQCTCFGNTSPSSTGLCVAPDPCADSSTNTCSGPIQTHGKSISTSRCYSTNDGSPTGSKVPPRFSERSSPLPPWPLWRPGPLMRALSTLVAHTLGTHTVTARSRPFVMARPSLS